MRILALRQVGCPIETIAAKLGCGEKTVRRVVQARIAQLNESIRLDAAGIRAQHLNELQGLRQRLAPLLTADVPGDRLRAIQTWLNLLQREAALLAIDAPARVELHAETAAAQALLEHLAVHLPPAHMEAVIDVLAQHCPEGPGSGSSQLASA